MSSLEYSPRNNSTLAERRAERERVNESGREELRLDGRCRLRKNERTRRLRLRLDGEIG